jgi:hypothetical protein
MSPVRHIFRALVVSAAIAVPTVVSNASVSAEGVSCPVVYWGSMPKVVNGSGPTESIFDVRTGQHACFDRFVVDINGSGPVGYDVRYVDNVYTEGEGSVVALAGGAKVQIIARTTNFDIDTGVITYTPIDQAHSQQLTNVVGYQTFRQVAFAGSFEGQTTFGLGIRARLPMRAFVLDGPGAGQRLVVDVAHSWGGSW